MAVEDVVDGEVRWDQSRVNFVVLSLVVILTVVIGKVAVLPAIFLVVEISSGNRDAGIELVLASPALLFFFSVTFDTIVKGVTIGVVGGDAVTEEVVKNGVSDEGLPSIPLKLDRPLMDTVINVGIGEVTVARPVSVSALMSDK